MPAAEVAEPGFRQWVPLLGAVLPGTYLLLTSTRYLIDGIWHYDAKRLVEFALLLCLCSLPALNRSIRNEFKSILSQAPGWIILGLLGAFGLGCISAAVNARSWPHFVNSLSDVFLLALLVLSMVIVAACRRLSGLNFDRIAVAMLAATTLVVGVQEILGIIAAHANGLSFSYDIALQYFAHPRFFNQFQSWTIPAIVALPMLFSKSSIARWGCIIALGLAWFILFMTAGRGTTVGLAAAFLLSLTLFRSIRKPLVSYQVLGIFVGFLIYGAVLLSFELGSGTQVGAMSAALPSTSESTHSGEHSGLPGEHDGLSTPFFGQSLGREMWNTSGRTRMWSVALRDVMNSPWVGIGPMNYACTSADWFGHPHNFPLQLAAEWGLIATLLILGTGIALALKATRATLNYNGPSGVERQVAALLLTGCLAASIHALFSGAFIMPASQVTGILVGGTLLGTLSANPVRAIASTLRISPALLQWAFVPGLFMAVFLCIVGAVEVGTMKAREEALKPRILAPRMWQNSKVCTLYTETGTRTASDVSY